MEEKSVNRKVVVITGASRGLGQAMAAEFMRQDCVVAGCGRSPARAEFKSPGFYARVDVRDAKAVEGFAEQVIQKLGAPDLLINNAAIINRSAPLWELSPAEFGDILEVNLKGVFHMIRAFLPAMLKRNSGVVVNFSSGWGRSTSPEVASYCATKYAIEGLTQALAQELPSGMAAIPLNPGIIDTEMLRSCFGEGAGSYPKPEEWAQRTVPFLLGLGPRQNGRSLTAPGG
jgi:NAD(P)-dependent dehydrogenase (short-subunit alcohol dehydrogenase family)